MAWARHGHGMASVNQTRPHCVNQMGKTHSKPLAARHGRGTAWARLAMCESAFNELKTAITVYIRNISQADLQKVFGNKIKRVQACMDARGRHFQHLL